ncbi:MAG: redox-sensitive transcriptional activator SoxR [Rhizobiaceae bacterium]|nr:redox-sensitive transcriptional activator SoxR [Rhizobiaceae bacterium]
MAATGVALKPNQLPIGEVARRTGLSVSAIRFYEERGLVTAGRNRGGQRRFARSDIRRLSFILIAQNMGFSLQRIASALSGLPTHRAPSKAEWAKMAEGFRGDLEDRIATLSRFRDRLDTCIGCGCLSLDDCGLYNTDDKAGRTGSGPRYVIGTVNDPQRGN